MKLSYSNLKRKKTMLIVFWKNMDTYVHQHIRFHQRIIKKILKNILTTEVYKEKNVVKKRYNSQSKNKNKLLNYLKNMELKSIVINFLILPLGL